MSRVRQTAESLPELDQWLLAHDSDIHSLHYAFADAVCFAELLHKVFPQLLHPRNYFSCNSPILRYNNWKLLNQRVLAKVGLKQSTSYLRELAKGTPGAIEPLLINLMIKELSLVGGDHRLMSAMRRKVQIDDKKLDDKKIDNKSKHMNKKLQTKHVTFG